jgi:hypothetical protein
MQNTTFRFHFNLPAALALCAAALFATGASGCKKDKSDAKGDKESAQSAMDHGDPDHGDHAGHDHGDHARRHAARKGAPAKQVKVPAKGKKYDPPIKPEQLPEGVWYCDMGTVHYARGEKGDGKCPLCMMRLKQKK